MSNFSRFRPPFLMPFALLLMLDGTNATAESISDWEASSGLLPTQISPPYQLLTSGSTNATLSPSYLTISTSGNSSELVYQQTSPVLDTSKSFEISAGVKFISGTSSLDSRAAAAIGFTTGAGVGNVLYIDNGVVFLENSSLGRGPTAFVPTTDGFHTYTIDVLSTGVITVSYDGSQIITGSTFSNESFNGNQQRIIWGDETLYASGVSEWSFFEHNALVVPEPSSITLLGVALGISLIALRGGHGLVERAGNASPAKSQDH